MVPFLLYIQIEERIGTVMNEYKRIKRTLVHEGTIINFYEDKLILPNGKEAKYDFIGHRGAAAIVAETEDGKIVMVNQYRNALERNTIEIPAGGLNAGETFKEAAIRELEEETGYQIEVAEHLIDIYTTVAFCNEKIGIYCGKAKRKESQHLDEDEFVAVEEHTLEELLDWIMTGKIQDSKTISGILAYKQWKNRQR